MTLSTAPLFRPFAVGSLTVPNRIVMAPMTRNFAPGGVLVPEVAGYYRRRAEQGVGLIITEGTVIDHPAAANDPRVPRFHGEDALEAWARVVREVHAAGGRIMPQLWHVGTVRTPGQPPNPTALPVGPSGLSDPATRVSEPLTLAEIEGLVAVFGSAAASARRLGFDGLELHGAHGFLIDQFLWGGTNRRTDLFGGDRRGRTRFAVEVVRACRREVGAAFPIVFRWSQFKAQDYAARLAATPDELAEVLEPLVDAGVDVFDCSTRRCWEPAFEGSPLSLAGWTRKVTGRPVIAVGSVGLSRDISEGASYEPGVGPRFGDSGTASLDRVLEVLARDEVDLVAVGRALIADPAWVTKVREQRPGELLPFNRAQLEALL